MPSHALQQPALFEAPARTADDWVALLSAAFADRSVRTDFLPFAEEAVAAYPGDPVILLFAAAAALLDARPERAKVFLKRFSKRAKGRSEPCCAPWRSISSASLQPQGHFSSVTS